jgi:hypothetical protein
VSEEETDPVNRVSSLEEISRGLDRILAGQPISPRPKYTVLDEDGNLQPATLMQWAMWFEKQAQRFILLDYFMDRAYKVSTVFLGLDHNYAPTGPGHYFETMVFGPPQEKEIFGLPRSLRDDLWMSRCETLKEAKAMHQDGIRWLEQQDFFDASPENRA